MTSKMNRRSMLRLAGLGGLGAIAAVHVQSSSPEIHVGNVPGTLYTPSEFFSSHQANYYGSYPTMHIPHHLRAPNRDGSCVHLATAICLIANGQYDLARAWTASHRGGEYSSRHITRMERLGLLFAVETQGNPSFVDFWAGHTNAVAKRPMGVSYNARHVMNLLDIDPSSPGARAYLLNNQNRSGDWNWNSPVAAETSREEFLTNWDRNGGWAFVVLGTTAEGVISPIPPIPYV